MVGGARGLVHHTCTTKWGQRAASAVNRGQADTVSEQRFRASSQVRAEARRAARRARLTETGGERSNVPYYDAFDGTRVYADGTTVNLVDNGNGN